MKWLFYDIRTSLYNTAVNHAQSLSILLQDVSKITHNFV